MPPKSWTNSLGHATFGAAIACPVERVAADVAVIGNVVEPHADALRDARLLHGHAIQGCCGGHCLFAVRDDHKPRPAEKILEHVDKSPDVGLVERGIDL